MKYRVLKHKSSADDSEQYSMVSEQGVVDFSVLNGEMWIHNWTCPGEGRVFLKELEKYAKNKSLKLVIPNPLNPKLVHILSDNKYYSKEIDYEIEPGIIEKIEIWQK